MKHLLFVVAVFLGVVAGAEEYGVIVNLAGETPVAVPFFKCDPNQRDIATETIPATCRSRGTRDPVDTFFAERVRITNLGDTIVWLHIGEARLPVLPRTVYNFGPSGFHYRRIFLSASGSETARAHVFVSDPVQHERTLPKDNDGKR